MEKKMQIQINRLLVVLMATVLLLFGGCDTKNTTQNNMTSNSSNQNTASQNSPTTLTLPPPCTGGVTLGVLEAEINTLPPPLKNQFKEVNSGNGTISLDYNSGVLTFTGYITGNGNNLNQLLQGFDRFRGRDCVRVVRFLGDTASTSFEWRADSNGPTPPSTCHTDVNNIIRNSRLARQIGNNLFYTFPPGSTVLTFSGFVGDGPANGQFNSLFAQLQQPMTNGCLSKVVFTNYAKTGAETTGDSQTTKDSKTMLLAPFDWMLCEDPLVECNGECVPRPCGGSGNVNANININTNTNININANANSR
jgi:hypothetical protein